MDMEINFNGHKADTHDNLYDVLIIGGGPAGATVAIYTDGLD